jgi:hypothetical protein
VILTFRQPEEESLTKSWYHFIDLTFIGLDLFIPNPILLQHFYEGLSKDYREPLDISSGVSFLHLLASEARATIERIISAAACWTEIHFKPPRKKKEFFSKQKEEVLIAKSQPLQSQDATVNSKPPISHCKDDDLDFQFCKMLVN